MLETLHSTGLQRGDRMAAALDDAKIFRSNLVDFALRIPDSMKYGPSGQEKDLRKAFSHLLPR